MNIFFDGMNIAFRSHYIYDTKQGLATPEGLPSGTIYGFMKTMVKFRSRYPHATFHVVWDSTGEDNPNWRKELFPEYKAGRNKEGHSTCLNQIDVVKVFLHHLGIGQVEKAGEEADDLIASLVSSIEGPKIIISSDRDFLQLVSGDTVLLLPDESKVYDVQKVIDEYGVEPTRLVSFRALDGDKSDNIPGIPRFRKKVIASLINEHEGDMKSLYAGKENWNLTKSEITKLTEFEDQAFVNLRLMEFRTPAYEITKGTHNVTAINRLCDKLSFKSLKYDLEHFSDTKGFMRFQDVELFYPAFGSNGTSE